MIDTLALHDVWCEEHPNVVEHTYTKLVACPKLVANHLQEVGLADLPKTVLLQISCKLGAADR
jgi:hypothetical protein